MKITGLKFKGKRWPVPKPKLIRSIGGVLINNRIDCYSPIGRTYGIKILKSSDYHKMIRLKQKYAKYEYDCTVVINREVRDNLKIPHDYDEEENEII